MKNTNWHKKVFLYYGFFSSKKLHQRSISSTCYQAFFTLVDPKGLKIQSCHHVKCLFALLGSTSIKAVRTMLMKLTPGEKEAF